MKLSRLIKKKTRIILGINSGTSVDGIDMAVIRIARTGKSVKIKYIDGLERKFPNHIRQYLLEKIDGDFVAWDDVIVIDQMVGSFIGQTASKFIAKLKQKSIRVDAIASHGQTVRHLPASIKIAGRKFHGTLQLGQADLIAEITGQTVVSDFRQGAVAKGHEGAPITTPAVNILLSDNREARLIANIGGMSNYFYLPKKNTGKILAADCGPGNSLIDLLAQKLFGRSFDSEGKLARKGNISMRLLSLLLADPFFTAEKYSTGRERFGSKMADMIISFGQNIDITREDLMATACEFTARAIAGALSPILKKNECISKLYLTGGGRKNKFLVECIGNNLENIAVLPVDVLGYNGDLMEAITYAVMGDACLSGMALEHQLKNSAIMAISGKISQS